MLHRVGAGALCILICSSVWPAQINEIRIDQPGSDQDEYFELVGDDGESLDGLTYLVIGDSNSGTIEAVLNLDGRTIPDDGFFLVSEGSFQLDGAIPDMVANLNFENSDNVTHLLVQGFSGMNGMDLDEAEDGTLDQMPWGTVVDAVGLVETVDPENGNGEFYYGTSLGFVDVGPNITDDGSFVPAHIYREGDTDGPWIIGQFETSPDFDDTPGVSNSGDVNKPSLDCDFNNDNRCDVLDIDLLTGNGNLVEGVTKFESKFDLTADGVLNDRDLEQWLLNAALENGLDASYFFGDTNLDEVVDAIDLNALALNWGADDEKVVWSRGDVNGDGVVDTIDLNKIALSWLLSNSPPDEGQRGAVPEPSTATMCWLAFAAIATARRCSG